MSIHWQIKTYDTLESTQDTLKTMIRQSPDLSEGVAVRTHLQTKGYGRHKRSWKGEDGNISLSFVICPDTSPANAAQIAIVTGISLIKTIGKFIDQADLRLKWPNDVMINNKKCAGILVENISNQDTAYMVVGVGVNINNAPLEISESLNNYAHSEINLDAFINDFLSAFATDYDIWKQEGFKPVKDQFIKHTYAVNTGVSVNLGTKQISGKFIDLDDNGNLEIKCNETHKIHKITSGEVFMM